MFGRGRGFGSFRERFFDRGDLKYVILELLRERPRHGYDIIRALEERFRGMYAPSPGTVYPTLQMVKDMGYATSQEQDGKRVYTLTEAGRQFLGERGPVVDGINARIGDRWEAEIRDEVKSMMHELQDLGRLFRRQWRGPGIDADQLRRVREVISRAYRDIEAILTEDRSKDATTASPGSSGGAPGSESAPLAAGQGTDDVSPASPIPASGTTVTHL